MDSIMTVPGVAASSRGHILIADDEDSVLLSTSELLQREGFTCQCARDAAEAARLLETETFDLLLSDIRMPGNQDLDLIRQVPKLNAGLPVILMTGYPSMPTAMQAIQLPVFAYMVKPIDFDELLQNVHRGVSFRRVATTLSTVSDRLQGWITGMQDIRQQFEASPQAAAQGTFYGALALTLGNMAGALLDLQELFKLAMGLDHRDPNNCQVPNCPRIEALEKALAEGIQVLEATKGAYRSKELGALRQRFEALLPQK
jgi:CheY-like chemotaxis protein